VEAPLNRGSSLVTFGDGFRERETATSAGGRNRYREHDGTCRAATRPGGDRRPARYIAVLQDYAAALQTAPRSDQTRRTYTSKVRQFHRFVDYVLEAR
jgi:hypothetical protein